MTYKQIETAREIRLWIGQIIVPACSVAMMALTVPEVRQAVAEKINATKQTAKSKVVKFKQK